MSHCQSFSFRRLIQGLLMALLAFWVVPAQAQYIYYSQSASQGGFYYIGRANQDGTGTPENTWLRTGTGPKGVAVYFNHIYWVNNTARTIGMAPTSIASSTDAAINNAWLDATGGGAAPSATVRGIAVRGNYIYWTDSTNNFICRALLTDPVNQHDIPWITITSGSEPYGIAVDDSYVYWTQENGGGTGNGTIGRAPLTYPTGGFTSALISSLDDPTGIGVNSQFIFWYAYNRWAVDQATLDGTVVSASPNFPFQYNLGGTNPEISTLCVADKVYCGGLHELSSFALDGSGSVSRPYIATAAGDIPGVAVQTVKTVVTLTSFTAMPGASQVVLAWKTGSEVDTAGFNLWRSASATGTFVKVNAAVIPARGTGASGATYAWTDTNVSAGQTWYYKLEDLDTNGVSTLHGPISASVGAVASIITFQATPTDIFLGGGSLLNWTVSGSPSLSITGLGPVTSSGLWVTPQLTTSYTLTDGQGAQNVATVNVKPFALLDMPGLSKAWGSARGGADYDPSYDLNGDGTVDDADVALCFKGL